MRMHWLICVVLACGDASSPDAPLPDSEPPLTAEIDGMVFSAATPLAGATICLLDHPAEAATTACTTSGVDGTWAMVIPVPEPDSYYATRTTAPGHLGMVFLEYRPPASVGFTYRSQYTLLSDATATEALVTNAGFTYPANGSSFIRLRATGLLAGKLEGATATLSPPSGTGPVYLDELGQPDPTLTSTTTSGGILFGNVAPGQYSISVSAPQKTCTVRLPPDNSPIAGTWPPRGGGTVDVETASDALTDEISVRCL